MTDCGHWLWQHCRTKDSPAALALQAIEKFIPLPALLRFHAGLDIDIHHQDALIAAGRKPRWWESEDKMEEQRLNFLNYCCNL